MPGLEKEHRADGECDAARRQGDMGIPRVAGEILKKFRNGQGGLIPYMQDPFMEEQTPPLSDR
ncbi:hypothetical protein HYZ99_00270 [Candidatus Peregrinibacteria bacterium]|nr:hypothetical protein [Candidatus Peregrinibacteria bacterium]